MSVAAIVVAAGRSSRFGNTAAKKPFVMLGGLPVWQHCVRAFLAKERISQVVFVVSQDDLKWVQTSAEQGFDEVRTLLRDDQSIAVVAGGDSRAASVGCGLASVDGADYVAVHDAARPLVAADEIDAVIASAQKNGAAILATRITSTVKRAAETAITETVDRESLWLAQTPQVARREWFSEPYNDAKHRAWSPSDPTDEAQLLERCGRTVHIVEASARNFKITTQEDLMLAQSLLALNSVNVEKDAS